MQMQSIAIIAVISMFGSFFIKIAVASIVPPIFVLIRWSAIQE